MRGGLGVFLALFLIITACTSGGVVEVTTQKEKIKEAAAVKYEGAAIESEFDSIKLDYKGYKKDRKGSVKFDHRKHAWEYEVFCWECHHDYKDGKNIYSAWNVTDKCNKCHDPLKEQDKAMKLQKAFHLSCKNCHVERAIFNKEPRAYRKCVKCHEKKL